MSQLDVDKIVPQSGTSLQLGENGDTISVPAGATFDASAGTFTLPDGSVVEAKIANSAVTNDKLAGSIANSKLANSAITINGSSVSLGGSTTILTGTSWQSAIKTSTFTAAAGEGYFINTSGGAFEVDLPGSPSVGDLIEFVDFSRSFGTNALTLDPGSLKFQGNTSPKPVYSTNGQGIRIVYSGTTQGWIPTSDDDVSLKTPQTYTCDFLVIAGGGAASSISGPGGGGAGGYRASYNNETSGGGGSSETALSLTPGTVYTITVGAGGAGTGSSSSVIGNAGNDSSISGSDITDIVSVGGGIGGFSSGNFDGGSGGGGRNGAGGSGTANQGHDGGTGVANAGGGGGGAGAVGANGASNTPGNGGNGVASTITGSSVTRGGGGGAGTYQGSLSSGGSGGGGNGGRQDPETNSTAGAANTGGGGGAKASYANIPGGGSGIVVLRMATADYTGTTSGSPSVSTSGSDTILVFNASGSYTA